VAKIAQRKDFIHLATGSFTKNTPKNQNQKIMLLTSPTNHRQKKKSIQFFDDNKLLPDTIFEVTG